MVDFKQQEQGRAKVSIILYESGRIDGWLQAMDQKAIEEVMDRKLAMYHGQWKERWVLQAIDQGAIDGSGRWIQGASNGSGSNRRSDNNVLFLFMSINDNVENK